MTIETWLLFIVVTIVPVMSPGPSAMLALGNSLRFGHAAALFSALGNSMGMMVVGVVVSFGLAAVVAASATAFFVLKLVGGAYLCYLGLRLWLGKSPLAASASGPDPSPSRLRLVSEAFLVAVTNPKAIFLISALFPPFLSTKSAFLPQVAALSLTYGGIVFAKHMLISFASGWLRRYLRDARAIRIVRRVIGSVMIAFGGSLALSSR
ncbi:LysE family translocator [Rhizobiales bacterium]|uniref:LysE family translocator n=1 Tax=Hongsoonwoonella zoysiae TaxID=2821844 RepID=UPI001560B3A7|nr:LysE family translocator [Hongsoonwoonella zoysiae]NRG17899.1 LysE family translocator [Hongsoonwoonella zoysiae]